MFSTVVYNYTAYVNCFMALVCSLISKRIICVGCVAVTKYFKYLNEYHAKVSGLDVFIYQIVDTCFVISNDCDDVQNKL